MRTQILCLAIALLYFSTQPNTSTAESKTQKAAASSGKAKTLITDFSKPDARSNWRTVNDNVMGGRSKGGPSFDGKILTFSGSTNTNGGGFSSIRTGTGKLDPKPFINADQVILRVKGDGRTYIFTLRTNVRYGRMSASYWHKFKTEKDQWVEVRLPLKDFYPTFYGKNVTGRVPALDKLQIKSMGLMIYDKNDGPFKLDVDWIKTASQYKAATDLPPM